VVTRDLDAETAHRWQQFRALSHTRNHWDWRRGWRPGRHAYWFFVCFDDDPAVDVLARRYLTDLREPGLDPAVPGNLHISVQHVGFTDEVSADEATALLDAARRLTVPRLRLLLGPVDPNPESVVLRVTPWEPITGLRRRLREVTAEVLGAHRLTGADDHFWPHVTIGYTNAELPTGPLLRRLAALPPRPPVAALVCRVDLVVLNRDNRAWTWGNLGAVPLVGAPPGASGD
jgi:2'-5' RNA ligase